MSTFTKMRRLAVAVSGVALVGSSLAVPTALAAPAAAATCPQRGVDEFNAGIDVDGDKRVDVTFGEPSRTVAGKKNAGAVLVTSCARTVLLTSSNAALGTPVAGGRFGTAVAAVDVDRDGYTDLIIGAPGQRGTGAVGLVFGSSKGLGQGKAAKRLTAPGLRTGDRYGTALHVQPAMARLWVGAPGTDVGKAKDAGALHRIDGIPSVVKTTRFVQGAGRMSNQAESGDRFGQVLSPWSRIDGLTSIAVGVPREDIGKRKDAGALVVILSSGRGVTVSQDTAGVAGTAETGDLFGAAVISGAVGVPGESLGRAKNAGAVQPLRTSCAAAVPGCTLRFSSPRLLTQASPGVGGAPESGDRLGSSLARIGGDGTNIDIAAGVPGEDVGRAVDAGAVTGLSVSDGCSVNPAVSCPTWSQNSRGIPGTAERGDALGSTVTAYGVASGDDEEDYRGPVVGAPGEDLGSRRDAGTTYGRDGSRAGTATAERLGEVAPLFLETRGTGEVAASF